MAGRALCRPAGTGTGRAGDPMGAEQPSDADPGGRPPAQPPGRGDERGRPPPHPPPRLPQPRAGAFYLRKFPPPPGKGQGPGGLSRPSAPGGPGGGGRPAFSGYPPGGGGPAAEPSLGPLFSTTVFFYRDEPQSYSGRPP